LNEKDNHGSLGTSTRNCTLAGYHGPTKRRELKNTDKKKKEKKQKGKQKDKDKKNENGRTLSAQRGLFLKDIALLCRTFYFLVCDLFLLTFYVPSWMFFIG